MGCRAQAGKDISPDVCIDFDRARTPPWDGSGGRAKTPAKGAAAETAGWKQLFCGCSKGLISRVYKSQQYRTCIP